jgi:hypothetical protein
MMCPENISGPKIPRAAVDTDPVVSFVLPPIYLQRVEKRE